MLNSSFSNVKIPKESYVSISSDGVEINIQITPENEIQSGQ